jgi:hypothetical protein
LRPRSVAKKRWILKFDDPQKLAQIDAVFVTVEPNGGSSKPSGKPFLYAYLKVNPNHPYPHIGLNALLA